MNKLFFENKLEKLFSEQPTDQINSRGSREPIHVVYGGANLFKAETPQKLGQRALESLDSYAPNFAEFAQALWIKGADMLPKYIEEIQALETHFKKDDNDLKKNNFAAWFALTVYHKSVSKLKAEPIEDFRIDFEDGYGFRSDKEEDAHARTASTELAKLQNFKSTAKKNNSGKENHASQIKPLPFCGFRIKSLSPETYKRALRTLDIFLKNFTEKCGGKLPKNFVVTLPKITHPEQVQILNEFLSGFEKENKLKLNSIGIELMVETPQAIISDKGEVNLPNLYEAAPARITSAHFGAFDYTARFGISALHQHLRHEACNFAREMMQICLISRGVRLSDSVTTEMPIPIFKGNNLTLFQINRNKIAVHKAWNKHFNNVTSSLINGFYQSWDLHPAQLVARYAAVYSFFLESKDAQAQRLRTFIEKASQAVVTGNTFDDAASAQGLLNFFNRAENCGAMTETEIIEATGLSKKELHSGSFQWILENRQKEKN